MTVRFLVDAQLPPLLAKRLQEAGYEARHVNRIGLGAAPDRTIWERARDDQATLITKDVDFVLLTEQEPMVPAVVWVRIGNVTNPVLWQTFAAALDEIVAAIESGEKLVELR